MTLEPVPLSPSVSPMTHLLKRSEAGTMGLGAKFGQDRKDAWQRSLLFLVTSAGRRAGMRHAKFTLAAVPTQV
jgi:hypothetical protein